MKPGTFFQGPITFHYGIHTHIGKNCFFNFNLTVQDDAEVTIGDNCVIGAGSVVVKSIPANSFAAGNPCRVIREITDADSMVHKLDVLADNTVMLASGEII